MTKDEGLEGSDWGEAQKDGREVRDDGSRGGPTTPPIYPSWCATC